MTTIFFLKKVMIWLENSKSVYVLPMLCQAGRAGHFGLCHSSIRFQFSLLLLSMLTPTYVCKSANLQVWPFFQIYKFSASYFGHSGSLSYCSRSFILFLFANLILKKLV